MNIKTIRVGGLYGNSHAGRIWSPKGLCPTIKTITGGYSMPLIICNTEGKVAEMLRIRKLTPKECWRLMGFEDKDIDQCINAGLSNTQLYKQAGNSIVVDVLQAILQNLLMEG